VLLEKLGHPERRLPPVIHVAGTNGKGSVCAFLRAMAEAAGLRTHVFISPHLIRFNERIRIAGALVSDAALADALEELERRNAGDAITVFEMITAVALFLFSKTPAELCVLEVGLGGRFDATNVVSAPAACAITSVSMDHREFLGDSLAAVAFEKAGILKAGVPCAVGVQAAVAREVILARAEEIGAPVLLRDRDWSLSARAVGLRYEDAAGFFDVPLPSLAGVHQWDNAGIAIAALRAARVGVTGETIAAGVGRAEWPARLQRLGGNLEKMLPEGWELFLDGGHNPGAGIALAEHLRGWADRPVHLIVGMKQAKDSAEFLRPMIPHAATLWAVAEPGQHLALPVAAIVAASGGVARVGPTVADALRAIPKEGPPARVLICGSLYLAGEVLKLDAGDGGPG